MRDRKCVDTDVKGGREELGRREGGENMIRMNYVRNLFSKEKNRKYLPVVCIDWHFRK